MEKLQIWIFFINKSDYSNFRIMESGENDNTAAVNDEEQYTQPLENGSLLEPEKRPKRMIAKAPSKWLVVQEETADDQEKPPVTIVPVTFVYEGELVKGETVKFHTPTRSKCI